MPGRQQTKHANQLGCLRWLTCCEIDLDTNVVHTMSLVTGEQFTEGKSSGQNMEASKYANVGAALSQTGRALILSCVPLFWHIRRLWFLWSSAQVFPSNTWVCTIFFSSYAENPPEADEIIPHWPRRSVFNWKQWRVSTQTINLHPARLVSCSLPFQQGSYFSTRPSLLVRQSVFHLLIGNFFNLLCLEGPWRRRHMSSLLSLFIYRVLSTRWRFRCFYFPSTALQCVHS